jgi:hypothetical protein
MIDDDGFRRERRMPRITLAEIEDNAIRAKQRWILTVA